MHFLNRSSIIILSLIGMTIVSIGQVKSSEWEQTLENFSIEPVLGFQVWASYTIGQRVLEAGKTNFTEVDNRLNFQFRRSRIGFKGQAYERLWYNMTMALDLVGRDELSATEGGINNGGSPKFRAWNAFIRWKLSKDKEFFHLSSGYLLPQIGRASITPALRSNSMEKAWSQNYLRRHMTGSGPGRTVGANLGGLFLKNDRFINSRYDFGIFSNTFGASTSGLHNAPMFVGRIEFFLGDPEHMKYKWGRQINYFEKRNGLSVAFAGSYQGASQEFNENAVIGADFLWNWGKFSLDGETHQLIRTANASNNGKLNYFAYTGYLRSAFNIILNNGATLEPVLMWMYFKGPSDAMELLEASKLGSLQASESKWNFGANYYFNTNLKLSLFYTLRDGNSGDFAEQHVHNNYFGRTQDGLPYISGDWIGLGMVVIL